MVLFIFEGVDNLGKSTIISKLSAYYGIDHDIFLIHSSSPKCKQGEDPKLVQSQTFIQQAQKCNVINKAEHLLFRTNKTVVFMDRSFYGEFCYGQIYRNQKASDVLKMIKATQNELDSDITVITVHLEATPRFVVAHDDDKSFTSSFNAEDKLLTVVREIEMFNRCFELANPTNYMKINVEASDNQYRNIDDICNEILTNIKNLNITI